MLIVKNFCALEITLIGDVESHGIVNVCCEVA